MLVNSLFKLKLYVLKQSRMISLSFRKVEGFVNFIREEIIITDGSAQAGAFDQVRMEQQCKTCRLYRISVIRYSVLLFRGNEDQCSFLVIVVMFSVKQIST